MERMIVKSVATALGAEHGILAC